MSMISSFDLSIEKEKIDEIFQVSINSKKLISILKRLEENHIKLQQKIQRIDEFYKEGDSVLNNKINSTTINIKTIINQEFQQVRTQLQTQMRKYQEKHMKQLHEKQLRINELKYSFQTINDKINKVKSSLTEEIQHSVRTLSSDAFSLKRTFQNSQEELQSSFEVIFIKLENYKSEIDNNQENIFEMEVKLKRFAEFIGRPHEVDRIICPDKRFQQSFNSQKYSKFLKTQNDLDRHSKSKQSSKKLINKSILNNTGSLQKSNVKFNLNQKNQSNENYMSTLQYASISAKVESLQKAIQQNASKNNCNERRQSIVKRGPKKKIMKTISFSKDQLQKTLLSKTLVQDGIQDDQPNLQIVTNIFKKLEAIEKSVQTKEKNLKKLIEQIKDKQIINDEKIEFTKQKIIKIVSEITQIKIKLLTTEKKTGPQSDKISLTNVQNQIGKIIQRMDRQFCLKLNAEEYIMEKVKTTQKLRVLQENLIYKAEKNDVRKAICFLQDKIKEIILVMANEFNDQKIGAISKQPVKCLTCDKQVYRLDNIQNTVGSSVIRGMTSPKSSRDLGQKYNRIFKSKKPNRPTSKINLHNYTSATQVTQEKQLFTSFD